jgi:hypothetical protein
MRSMSILEEMLETPDDGRKDPPKHAEYYSKIK